MLKKHLNCLGWVSNWGKSPTGVSLQLTTVGNIFGFQYPGKIFFTFNTCIMKTIGMKTIPAIAGLFVSLWMVSCSVNNENNVDAEVYNTSGPASGAQQNPSVN